MLLLTSLAVCAQEGFPEDDVDDIPATPIENGLYPMLFIGVVLGYLVWSRQRSVTKIR